MSIRGKAPLTALHALSRSCCFSWVLPLAPLQSPHRFSRRLKPAQSVIRFERLEVVPLLSVSRFFSQQREQDGVELRAGALSHERSCPHDSRCVCYRESKAAREAVQALGWRRDDSTVRPHSRNGWLTPAAYAARFSPQQARGAALTDGSAPWPVAAPEQMENINRQTQVTVG